MDNVVELMLEKVEAHIDELYKCSNQDIIKIITELKKEPVVWAGIPDGNRKYLDGVLANPTDRACRGAIPHLTQALSHRMGFVASKLMKDVMIGDPDFDSVIYGRKDLLQLPDEKLIQFVRDFVNSDRVAKYSGKLSGNLNPLRLILQAYDKRHANDIKLAKAYLAEKKESIYNLVVKSFMPNIMGAIARSRAQ